MKWEWAAGDRLVESLKDLGSGMREGIKNVKRPGKTIIDVPVNGIAGILERGGDMWRKHGIVMSIVAAFTFGPVIVNMIKSMFGIKSQDEKRIDTLIDAKRAEAIRQMEILGAGNGGQNIDENYFRDRYTGPQSNRLR